MQPTFSMRKRGLEKAVDPPLRVREDWWVFERPFFNGKEGRVDFRKNLRLREYWWVFEGSRNYGSGAEVRG